MTKKKSAPKKVSTDQESYFDAERILDEKKVGGKWQYLIKWTGHDKNGKPWSPDWQPKENCTQLLIKEWELRKREVEQRNKENQESSNQEGDVVQEGDPVDVQDDKLDKLDNKMQMDIDKPDNSDDNLKQVLDKYCPNVDDDLKQKSQTLGSSNSKRDANIPRKNKTSSYPNSKIRLIKISPIQPSITSNSPIKNNISRLDNDETTSNVSNINNNNNRPKSLVNVFHYSSRNIRGKKFSLSSKSERVAIINLNKRGLDKVHGSNDNNNNNNNNSAKKRQRTEDVYDVNRKTSVNEKVEESRTLSTTSNVNNKKNHSQSSKIQSDQTPQSIPIYNIPSTQISNSAQVGAIHVNSETIKNAYNTLHSRASNKNTSNSNSTSSTSSHPPKFRPIAAKIAPSPTSGYTNVYSSSGTGKWTGNNNNNSSSSNNNNTSTNRQNSQRLASIRTPVPVDNFPKNSTANSTANSPTQTQADNNVSTSPTSAQHTSYFHRSYVQATSAPIAVPTAASNNVTQSNQSIDNQTTTNSQKASTSINKQPTTTTNERPSQQQSPNLQNPSTRSSSSSSSSSSTMESNDSSYNHPFYQLPLERLKEPTVTNIDLWMNEWAKAKSINDTLEKEKHDLLKEKNKYAKEACQLKLEVERRPQSDSETSETIKRYQDNVQKIYNKWLESQNKYMTKISECTKLELEHSKLQSEYNQVKKIVMGKHSEVETLKGELNDVTREMKEVKEENNHLKADWSRIVRNGLILMREDYHKIAKLQSSLEELISQRSNINVEIDHLRESFNQEVNKMRDSNYGEDDDEEYERLYQQVENLKLQNKLQETSLNMADENSKAAEESTKLMFELKKLNVEEILNKYDNTSKSFSFPNISNVQASTLFANLRNNSTTSLSNNNSNQSRTPEKVLLQKQKPGNTEISQGTNTNIIQARNVKTASLTTSNNLGPNLAEKPNAFRNSTTFVKANANSRTLSASTNSARVLQNKGAASSLRVRPTSSTKRTPTEMNVHLSTEKKLKVTANPKTKSIQQYFCEWNLCRRSFDDKPKLKRHIIEDHFSDENYETSTGED